MPTPSRITIEPFALGRRSVLLGGAASLFLLASPVQALNAQSAQALVEKVVANINSIIQSGQSEKKMISRFEKLFETYANVPAIAQQVLGPPARSASASELRKYTKAFQGYMARKYGKRFREFIGGWVEVESARARKSYFEVMTQAKLTGQPPFAVAFRVASFGGKDLFFDMIIEGISLIKTEAVEVRALYDAAGRSIAGLIKLLNQTG